MSISRHAGAIPEGVKLRTLRKPTSLLKRNALTNSLENHAVLDPTPITKRYVLPLSFSVSFYSSGWLPNTTGYSGEQTCPTSWPYRCVRSCSSSFSRSSTRLRAADIHTLIPKFFMWQKGGRPWKGGNGGSGTQHGFKGGGKGEGKSYGNRPPAYVMNAIESSAAVNDAFFTVSKPSRPPWRTRRS